MKKRFLLPMVSGLLLAACGEEQVENPTAKAGTSTSTVEADFSLQDVNESSPTFGQVVSPRDYLEQVSGWYFGRAT